MLSDRSALTKDTRRKRSLRFGWRLGAGVDFLRIGCEGTAPGATVLALVEAGLLTGLPAGWLLWPVVSSGGGGICVGWTASGTGCEPGAGVSGKICRAGTTSGIASDAGFRGGWSLTSLGFPKSPFTSTCAYLIASRFRSKFQAHNETYLCYNAHIPCAQNR
jgi:hypothetical protein